MAKEQFQGPVQKGYDVEHFRKTGETLAIDNSKEETKKQGKSFKKSKKIKVKKFLKKPKAKGIHGISSEKTLSRFAQSSVPLVREVERVEPVQDDRSQFFKREFKREERSINKWLS